MGANLPKEQFITAKKPVETAGAEDNLVTTPGPWDQTHPSEGRLASSHQSQMISQINLDPFMQIQ